MKAFTIENIVDDSQLLSSNVAEDDELQWSAGSYSEGDRFIEDHIIYESLIDANTAQPSVGVTTNPKTWAIAGVPNRWRMFDILRRSSLQTEMADQIVVEIEPQSPIDALSFFGLDANTINVQMFDDVTEVYNKDFNVLKTEYITDWHLWFHEYPEKEVRLAVMDLPNVAAGRLVITIDKTGSIAKCGKCVIGRQLNLYTTKTKPKTTLIPTSSRKRDDFGELVWTPGSVYREINFTIQVPTSSLDYIERKLMEMMAMPLVIVGSEKYVSLLIFGGIKGTPKSVLLNKYSLIDFVVEEI